MIDYLALTLVHGLLLIGLFRIVQDDALDPAIKAPKRANSVSRKPQVRRKSAVPHPSKRSQIDGEQSVNK